VEADRRLAGAGAALDDERRLRVARDQAVLVGLDGRDDVAHVRRARLLELLEQEVAAGDGIARAVERLVAQVDEPPSLRAEAAAQRHAVRVHRRRGVERPRRRRLPVADEHLLLVVVHPAAADVERLRRRVEIEPPEAEAALGVLERAQPLRRPRLERERRDLVVRRVRRVLDRLAHPVEVRVRRVDVRLLCGKVGVAHRKRARVPA
jgi:hypothetical protein